MAPLTAENVVNLVKRRSCYRDSLGRVRCYNSGWYNWGRWIVLGVILLVFFLFLCCLCITSRRKRRRGARPMYGTGWMSQGPLAPPPYQPPPQYSAQPDHNNGAYAPQQPKPTYGGQGQYNQGGYEMNNQQSHGGYAPPPGPPPNQYR